jgi:hypothetical protein
VVVPWPIVVAVLVVLAFGAYLEFSTMPWWLIVVGVVWAVGAAVWERRKR